MGEVYSGKVKVRLHWIGIPYDARNKAFLFALDNIDDFEKIRTEIKDFEEYTFNPNKYSIKAMQPNATPGIQNRNYINGLKEVLDLLLRFNY